MHFVAPWRLYCVACARASPQALPRAPLLTSCFLTFCLPCPCNRSGDIYQRHALAKLRAGSTEGFETYAMNPSLPELDRSSKLMLPAGDVI